jgi:Flp pilus assembly protein TadD
MTSPTDSIIARAEAGYRAGDYDAAAGLLAPLATADAPPAAALRMLGLCRLRQGAPTEALALLARAHDLAPNDPWARLHYGIGLQATGRHAQAAVLFRACQALLPLDPAPFLNLSTSLMALGDVPGAIAAARKARLRASGMPQTHYTLGLAYLSGDYYARATDCFRDATRLAPRFAEAWLNLGVARYRNGEIEAAKDAMRVTLEVDPANQAAAANLGVFLRLTGQVEAGGALLRGMVERHPEAMAARLNLAADLLQEDRVQQAWALLDRPPPADPRMRPHWLLQQALALIKLRRLPEARSAIDAIGVIPPALQPLLQWRLVLLAMEEGDASQARNAAAEMEATLDRSASMLPEHRIMGHYDLGKFWSGLREPDRAFPHWVIGHSLLSRFQPFSRKAYAEFVDATIALFDAGRLAEGARAGNRDTTPVFVVGMPRSGTTLIEQILAAHAKVHGAGERAALGQAFRQLGGDSESAEAARRIAALDRTALDGAADPYLAELHALDPGADRVIDKMPGNFRYLGLTSLLMPGARIIACDRDPRDIGLSIFTFRFYGIHGYAHDLSDLGWYIGQQQRLMAHWQRALPNPVMTVRLRDWVHDFSSTLRRVLDFLDLPYDAACETFYEAERRVRTVSRSQVRERVNARGLGRWRQYEQHLAPLIRALEESGALDDRDEG